LRRDLAGVGKKEIGDVPVLGKLMQLGGTVLIDRENSKSAREAMEPLVDVLQKEGRSVCIAPEGTRSTSTNLGRFKKGAFYLAMQAGVPIVPIVIHNAIDVAPRGQYVFRPATVKVSVLPPVDTRGWTAATMNEHVESVRDMFLVELDQMQFQPARKESMLAAERAAKKRATARANAEAQKAATAKKFEARQQGTATKTKVAKKPAKQSANGLSDKANGRSSGAGNSVQKRVRSTAVDAASDASRRPLRKNRRRPRRPSAPKVSARTLDTK
jgi:putative phosphoserine phosphatase/1-acylglycerol-3-phosphate O-acyltransferase